MQPSTTRRSQILPEILDIDNRADSIWADSAYRSQDPEWVLETIGFDSQIHERAYRNRPLTEQQQESDREKSPTRAKVEHIYGRQTRTLDWESASGSEYGIEKLGLQLQKVRFLGIYSQRLTLSNIWTSYQLRAAKL